MWLYTAYLKVAKKINLKSFSPQEKKMYATLYGERC